MVFGGAPSFVPQVVCDNSLRYFAPGNSGCNRYVTRFKMHFFFTRIYTLPELGWWLDPYRRPVSDISRVANGDGLAAPIILEFSCNPNFKYPGSLMFLNNSDRAFFDLARACLICRSKFAPALACTAASYTPPYELRNIHMFRKVMNKTADIPKWTTRNTNDDPEPTPASQCALPSSHIQFLLNSFPFSDCGMYHYSISCLDRNSNLDPHPRWHRPLSNLRSLVPIQVRALFSPHHHPHFHATRSGAAQQMDN